MGPPTDFAGPVPGWDAGWEEKVSDAAPTVFAVTVPTDPDALLAALDPEQREVASTFGQPVAVLAGAGTGKTRAITHRIAYGAATGALDPRAVLAVTFTTRAAGEMRTRLRRLGVDAQARTFHSAALRQLQYFWPRAYEGEVPPVGTDRMGMMGEAAGRLRLGADVALLRDLLAEVSWAKVSNVGASDYASVAALAGREVNGATVEQVAAAFEQYEQAKRARGVIDFDDILLCTVGLLSERADIAAQVRDTYRHLLVDEYQDVSPLQHTLLSLWLGAGHDLCVVGDPNQSIHAFAGATPRYLTRFRCDHPQAKLIRLVRDYRSTPEVVRLANDVLGRRSAGIKLVAQRPGGPEVSFAGAADEGSEAAGVVAWLRGLHDDGVPWRDMAVLFRINAQSPPLEAALSDAGIAYHVRGGDRFYERPEIRRSLTALRAAAAADTGAPPIEQVRDVLSGTGWTSQAPAGQGAARERWESIAALVDLAQHAAEENPEAGLGDIVGLLLQRAAVDHAPEGPGVTLSTLHSAKGLEWDAVALYGMHDGSVPFVLATTSDQIDEERRLLHVGITRAQRHLRLSWNTGRGRGPSRFLTGLIPGDAFGRRGSSAKRAREPRKEARVATCRVCGGVLTEAPDRKLGRHAGCPSSYDERLLTLLKEWRKQTADQARVPAYVVFTDATLIAIAEALPGDREALLAISGVGPTKADRYAEHVLALIEAASTPQNP